MFTGTMVHRAGQREAGRWRAAVLAVCVFGAVMIAGAWHIPALSAGAGGVLKQREWVLSVALAGLTFAVGLALRNRRVPRLLAWLGLVSYSVYLMLPVLLDLYDDIPFPAAYRHEYWLQGGAFAVFLAALLGAAALTCRLVEVPMRRAGKRCAARLDARPGRAGGTAQRLPARRSASVRMPAKDERTAASQAAATRPAHH